MGGGLNDFQIPVKVGLGKAEDILPGIIWQITRRMVKAILGVRLFKLDLDAPIRVHLGVDDLCAVVQSHKWIHHTETSIQFFSIHTSREGGDNF